MNAPLLVSSARRGKLAWLTMKSEPAAFRIVRMKRRSCAIVEEKDATPEQRALREIWADSCLSNSFTAEMAVRAGKNNVQGDISDDILEWPSQKHSGKTRQPGLNGNHRLNSKPVASLNAPINSKSQSA